MSVFIVKRRDPSGVVEVVGADRTEARATAILHDARLTTWPGEDRGALWVEVWEGTTSRLATPDRVTIDG